MLSSGMPWTDFELIVAVVAMSALTLLMYQVGCWYHAKSRLMEIAVFFGVTLVAFILAWSYFGRLIWAETIQSSSVLCWSNLTPIALGFSAGLASHTPGLRYRMRPVAALLLMLLAVGFVATPIARPLFFPLSLDSNPKWQNEVLMQSHRASCAPAAAVTLLRQHGIIASENELATACLSSQLGTAPLGLYRGLHLLADRHGFDAIVADKLPEGWLSKQQLPVAAIVQFEGLPGDRFQTQFLGNRFSGHVVTILGRTDGGRWMIGDPAVGRVSWSEQELQARYCGEGIYLRRKSN